MRTSGKSTERLLATSAECLTVFSLPQVGNERPGSSDMGSWKTVAPSACVAAGLSRLRGEPDHLHYGFTGCWWVSCKFSLQLSASRGVEQPASVTGNSIQRRPKRQHNAHTSQLAACAGSGRGGCQSRW